MRQHNPTQNTGAQRKGGTGKADGVVRGPEQAGWVQELKAQGLNMEANGHVMKNEHDA